MLLLGRWLPFVVVAFLVVCVKSWWSSSLWPSKLGSDEIAVVWKYRRGEIDGDTAAKQVSQRSRFSSILWGSLGFAGIGGMISATAGGLLMLPFTIIGSVIGAIAGAINPLGSSEVIQQFNGPDSTVTKYQLMQRFFSGSPDEAVSRAYYFFGCSSYETVDGLNSALAKTRVEHCETTKNELLCELTEYQFEMIKAYRN